MLRKVRRRASNAAGKTHGAMAMIRPASALTRRTLMQVALRIAVVVAVATVVSYWHVRARLEKQALAHLQHYVEQRRARESSDFTMAHANLSRFEKAYQHRVQARPAAEALARFDALFEVREDGTTRLRRHVFSEVGITGMIGKYADLNEALKVRLVAAYELLQAFGPAWDGQFINLYVMTPDPAVLMYWPSEPWALDASDWEVYGKIELMGDNNQPVVVAGIAPDRKPGSRGWSELYFDYGANQWLISAVKTIEVDGQSFMSVGHDLLLNEFIHRVLTSGIEGTYNLIIDQNARLIAHPHFMEAILAKGGALPLQEANNAHLQRIYDLARARQPHQVMVKNEANNEFLAVTQLEGPNWYLITVFPESIVAHEAIGTARWILLFGMLGLILEIGILYAVLRKQVARPLRHLMDATKQLASGHWNTALPVYQDDEIGQLAVSFNAMAQEIEARETALSHHNARLHDLNSRLERELEERQRTEQELERQREFHALLDTIDYGVLMLAPDLRVRVYNRAYASMLGMPADLLQNEPTYREILDFARQTGLYAMADDAWEPFVDHHLREIGQPTLRRQEWYRADGRIFQVQSIPFPDGSRMLTYFDLTVLKETEAALLAAKEQAEQASHAKSIFLASMSHELRTPLNAIIGYGEMLLEEAEDKSDAQLARDLGRIRNSGRHLLSLINDILDLSKIEAGRMEVKLSEFTLPPLLDDCMKTLEPIVDTERVKLIVCATPDLPVLTNDADKLRQVVINLLSNAAKFTHAGSITLRARRHGHHVIIDVADTGVGIPADMQTRIFEEFWQIEGSTTQNRSGTGLGLGISQKLAHLMGGAITLQSEVGVGSVFSVSIELDLNHGVTTV